MTSYKRTLCSRRIHASICWIHACRDRKGVGSTVLSSEPRHRELLVIHVFCTRFMRADNAAVLCSIKRARERMSPHPTTRAKSSPVMTGSTSPLPAASWLDISELYRCSLYGTGENNHSPVQVSAGTADDVYLCFDVVASDPVPGTDIGHIIAVFVAPLVLRGSDICGSGNVTRQSSRLALHQNHLAGGGHEMMKN